MERPEKRFAELREIDLADISRLPEARLGLWLNSTANPDTKLQGVIYAHPDAAEERIVGAVQRLQSLLARE